MLDKNATFIPLYLKICYNGLLIVQAKLIDIKLDFADIHQCIVIFARAQQALAQAGE